MLRSRTNMPAAHSLAIFQGRPHGWRRYRLIEGAQRGLVGLEFLAMRTGSAIRWAGRRAGVRSWEIAVTICAGANGFASRMLLGTPLDAHSST